MSEEVIETEVSIGEELTKVMVEEGISAAFGVTAHGTEEMLTMLPRYGVPCFNLRHENSGAYAAVGYTLASRKPSACFGTSGPGVTNMVSGVTQALWSNAPVLALCGSYGPNANGHWNAQEAYPEKFMETFVKRLFHIQDYRTAVHDMRNAIRTMRRYPPGPVAYVSSPRMIGRTMNKSKMSWMNERDQYPEIYPCLGNPEAVEKTIERLLKADRPLILAGDGVYWAHAEQELRDFCELTNIPCCGRRSTRGFWPEDESHPLSIGPGWRGHAQSKADCVVLLGMREGATETMMLPPPKGAYRQDIDYIQINEAESEIVLFLPTSNTIVGNCKEVLKQMIKGWKSLVKVKPKRQEWLAHVEAGRKRHWEKAAQQAANDKEAPIGAWLWARELCDYINSIGKSTVFLDSMTGSYAASDRYITKAIGRSLDGAGFMGVGHGIPMAFGAKHARPDEPMVVIMGDGGMGITGMEFEACIRYKKPIIVVVFNNSEWIGGGWELLYRTGISSDNMLIVDQRYDQMFEPIGVHGEFCTEVEQLKPAFERAFNSGKPAIVNCVVDPAFYMPMVLTGLSGTYLSWFGIERAKEYGLFSDAFWKLMETYPGGAEGLFNTVRQNMMV